MAGSQPSIAAFVQHITFALVDNANIIALRNLQHAIPLMTNVQTAQFTCSRGRSMARRLFPVQLCWSSWFATMKTLRLEMSMCDLPHLQLHNCQSRPSHLLNFDVTIRYADINLHHWHEILAPLIDANRSTLRSLKVAFKEEKFRLPRIDVSQLFTKLGTLKSLSLISLSGRITLGDQGLVRGFLSVHSGTLSTVQLTPQFRSWVDGRDPGIEVIESWAKSTAQQSSLLRYVEHLSLTMLSRNEWEPVTGVVGMLRERLRILSLKGFGLSHDDLSHLCRRLFCAPNLRHLTLQVGNPLPEVFNLFARGFPDLDELHLFYSRPLGVSCFSRRSVL